MKISPLSRPWLIVLAASSLAVLALLFLVLPHLLIADNAVVSDYILVLDGHDRSYLTALDLLRRGFGSRMFVCPDLPDVTLHGEELTEDQEFVRKTAGSLADRIELCSNEEDEDIATELRHRSIQFGLHKVLLVTPEAESRAQLISFRHQLPEYSWSVKPVPQRGFNLHWWRKPAWAKTYFESLFALEQAFRATRAENQPEQRSAK